MHTIFNMKYLASTATNNKVPHMLPEQHMIAWYSEEKVTQFSESAIATERPESQEHLKKQTRLSLFCYKSIKRFLFRHDFEEEDFKAQTYYSNLRDFFTGGATLVKTFKLLYDKRLSNSKETGNGIPIQVSYIDMK